MTALAVVSIAAAFLGASCSTFVLGYRFGWRHGSEDGPR